MRPDHVDVVGQRFNITYHLDPNAPIIWGGEEEMKVGDEAMGYTNAVMQEIVARGVPACGPDQERDTLMHEALHALFALTGLDLEQDDAKTESIISRLSPALLDMLRSNPTFTDHLLGPRERGYLEPGGLG